MLHRAIIRVNVHACLANGAPLDLDVDCACEQILSWACLIFGVLSLSAFASGPPILSLVVVDRDQP